MARSLRFSGRSLPLWVLEYREQGALRGVAQSRQTLANNLRAQISRRTAKSCMKGESAHDAA